MDSYPLDIFLLWFWHFEHVHVLFTQSQPLWVYECIFTIMSGEYCFRNILLLTIAIIGPFLFLWWSLSLEGRDCVIDGSSIYRLIYRLLFSVHWLWVHILIVIHSKVFFLIKAEWCNNPVGIKIKRWEMLHAWFI